MSLRAPIIAVAIAAVLLLASPFGLGMLAESSVRGEIENMGEYPALSFEVTDYQRGWMSSQATIVVTPGSVYQQMLGSDPTMQAILDEINAPFVVELNHGPILTLNGFGIGSYAIKAKLDAEETWVTDVESALGVSELFELRGQSGLLGGFDFEGEIPPFEVVDDEDTVTFTGLDFSGFTNGGEIDFDASIEAIAVQSLILSFTVDGLSLNGEYEFRPGSVALGNGAFSIDSIRGSSPLSGTNEALTLTGFSTSAETGLNASGNIDTSIVYVTESLAAEGIGIPSFTDVALGINLTNLDGEALREFSELYVQASNNPALLGLQALPIFDRLLATGPSLSLDPVRFTMDGESLEATLAVSIDPDAMPTGSTMDFLDSTVAMNAIDANLEMTASKALVTQLVSFSIEQQQSLELASMTVSEAEAMLAQTTEQMMGMVVGQGMLTDNGDTFTTSIVFDDGVATVNGTPVPLEALGLF